MKLSRATCQSDEHYLQYFGNLLGAKIFRIASRPRRRGIALACLRFAADWCEIFADSGGDQDLLQMIDSTVIRAHRCAAGIKGGTQNEALGRSRGGFSTKIYLRTNAPGLPIAAVLTGGEAHDVTAYDDLMDERDSEPGALLADEGYDSDAIRQDLRDRGATPEIPTSENRLVQHSVDKALYAIRSRIECCIGHLKEHRRLATCFDKTATSFLGFVMIACARRWFRFVHRA